MKNIVISYNKRFDNDGTVYTQNISVTEYLFEIAAKAINSEIKHNYPLKRFYVNTAGHEFYLKPLVRSGRFSFLNLTQARFINSAFSLSIKKDRNTCLAIK